jgi:haloacetate dehalogenase
MTYASIHELSTELRERTLSVSAVVDVQVMRAMGFARFSVVGHDRGGRVAYRVALDHPNAVERVALLDIIPTAEVFARADARFALAYLALVPAGAAGPAAGDACRCRTPGDHRQCIGPMGSDSSTFPAAVRKHYIDALRSPDVVHASCEEYRAAATLDRTHDDMDRQAARVIECPVLALWSKGGPLDQWYADVGGPLGILRQWAPNVRGRAVDGGHFFPEQNPSDTIGALREFSEGTCKGTS